MVPRILRIKISLALVTAFFSLATAHSIASLDLAQAPLFLTQPVRPIVMLNMSNDHQLFFKAYDDYSDLTGDGVPNTTYTHEHTYYGYFDSEKCYTYSSNRFVPARAVDADGYCNHSGGSAEWNGNFLNWSTMTRMDAVRKILYGGYRSTDTGTETVLERAFLPHDAHSFAKYYSGNDLPRLTPFAHNNSATDVRQRGITICNTTTGSGYSQSVTNPPLLRVARGNYSLWASNERWQCRWREDMSSAGQGVNDNDPALTGIHAYSNSPTKSTAQLGSGDYNVRVQVCVSGMLEDNCRSYVAGNAKPSGLLQQYGEKGEILFGLMTGSYAKNKSGGVLRKNIGDMQDEINVDTNGTFKTAPSAGGIINTLNLLRIYGYNYDTGEYTGTGGSDNCPFGLTGFSDGSCSNWGNPQSEIYLESLRYLAGLSANDAFSADDSGRISGLTTATWSDPLNNNNFCAPLSVLQFNASTSSFDGDTPGINALGITNINDWVNKIGAAEGIHGGQYFVGSSGTDNNQLCTPKTIASLSNVHGTCPDAPRLEGTYNIAGLAYYARTNSIRSNLRGDQKVRTYGIALSSATPSITIPVPDDSGRVVTILPACQNQMTVNGVREGNCAIVDFKIISQASSAGTNSGKLYINWEAAEQGGDYDSDMWGVLDYTVTSTVVTIATNVIQQSSGRPLGFGYVISGTTTDGFHAHSGINDFTYAAQVAPVGATINGCTNCKTADAATTNIYILGSSSANSLESPLYYAAKWGGYSGDLSVEDIASSEPETYFFATDPAQLKENLGKALDRVASEIGSASAVATNSTRLGTDTTVYQALFNSIDWSGEIKAIPLKPDGTTSDAPTWRTDASKFSTHDVRNIVTYDGTKGVNFKWSELSEAQKTLLQDEDRLNWLRGQKIEGMRERTTLLGDIVNSNPVYAGFTNSHFGSLPSAQGGNTATTTPYDDYVRNVKRNRPEMLYVNANDGMLHGFDANNGREIFAYVPSGAFDKLKNLTMVNYGTTANPHRYVVDGPIFVGDAYYNGQWRNILVGTLGAGGKGIFVLDVTDPENFGPDKVLFEYVPEGVGNVLGQPLLAPTKDGWKIFFGNGYNSLNQKARLYVVDLHAPASNKTYVVSAGDNGSNVQPNGLAEPSLRTEEGLVTSAYAGDLWGDMWKFNMNNNGSWRVTYGGNSPAPLFSARAPDGTTRQPITAAPTLGLNAKMDNAVMVYFGTGSYLTDTDNQAGTTVQSFYAIADTGSRITTTNRSELLQKTIAYQGFPTDGDGVPGTSGRMVRKIGNNLDTTWWDNKRGWYLDLIYNGVVTGERVISKPLLHFDRLLFPTLITSSDPCAYGGSGWLMELVAVGDRFPNYSMLGDDGLSLDFAVMDLSTVIRDTRKGEVLIPTSDIRGDINVERGEMPVGASGRMSWRQLR